MIDIHTLGTLKALVDAGDGPDTLLDGEIEKRLRPDGPGRVPWTGTIEAALTLFTGFGIEPGDLLAQVCRHHAEIKGEPFISRLPRAIVSIGLGYLIEQAEL